jgi:hypothetical protein
MTNLSVRFVAVIRFSLKVSEWRRRSFVNKHIREQWFAFRARLFRNTLGRCMQAQIKKPDRIFLLMDYSDKALFDEHFHGLDLPSLRPVFSKNENHFKQVSEQLLKEGFDKDIGVTRLDSDDLICRNFFNAIEQTIFDGLRQNKAFRFVIPCSGYKSDFVEIQRCLYKRPPFYTLFCPHYEGQSVYDFSHLEVRSHPLIDCYKAEWMQLIHGTNVANGFSTKTQDDLPSFEDFARLNETLVCQRRVSMDPEWFGHWAGFPRPDLNVTRPDFAYSLWDSIRVRWRRVKGKR